MEVHQLETWLTHINMVNCTVRDAELARLALAVCAVMRCLGRSTPDAALGNGRIMRQAGRARLSCVQHGTRRRARAYRLQNEILHSTQDFSFV